MIIDECSDKMLKAAGDNSGNEGAAFDNSKELYRKARGVWRSRGYADANNPKGAKNYLKIVSIIYPLRMLD